MRYFNFLLIVIILIFCGTAIALENKSEYFPERKIDAVEIKNNINHYGVKRTVGDLYRDQDTWHFVLRNIASGKHEWIEIAVILKSGSDAGVSEMLNMAMGEAIERSPKLVLDYVLKQNNYSVDDICSGPDVDNVRYSTYDKALSAIERRVVALERIDDKKIENIRNSCVKKLKESIKHLQDFFGIKDKSN